MQSSSNPECCEKTLCFSNCTWLTLEKGGIGQILFLSLLYHLSLLDNILSLLILQSLFAYRFFLFCLFPFQCLQSLPTPKKKDAGSAEIRSADPASFFKS